MTATLNSTGVLFNDSTQQNTAWIGPRAQVFIASGTFTVPTGVTAVMVRVFGGGGGGSGSVTSCPPTSGAMGGVGGFVQALISGLTPGQNISVTVGAGGNGGAWSGSASSGSAGGTSSFGTYATAT